MSGIEHTQLPGAWDLGNFRGMLMPISLSRACYNSCRLLKCHWMGIVAEMQMPRKPYGRFCAWAYSCGMMAKAVPDMCSCAGRHCSIVTCIAAPNCNQHTA